MQEFVGEFEAVSPLLDTENPVTYGAVALQNSYFEFRIDQEEAMKNAEEEYEKIAKDFEKISGRKYDIFEEYPASSAGKLQKTVPLLSGAVFVWHIFCF